MTRLSKNGKISVTQLVKWVYVLPDWKGIVDD